MTPLRCVALGVLVWTLLGPSGAALAAPAVPDKGAVVLERWRVVRVETHPEYRRFFLEGPDGTAAVEVTARRGRSGMFQTPSFLIQPAPGQPPHMPLLEEFTRIFEALDTGGGASGGSALTVDDRSAEVATRTAARVLWVVLVLAALLWRRRGAPRGPPVRSRAQLLAAGALVAGASFCYLAWSGGAPVLHLDSVRDVLMGRECLAGGACLAGPPTSVDGVLQGTLWPRILGALDGAGVGIAGIHAVVLALDALSVCGVFLAGARWLPEPRVAAPLAACAYLVLLAEGTDHHLILWHPSLGPAAATALTLALLGVAARGTWRRALVAGIALAVLVESHVASVAMLPALVVVVSARAERLGAALMAALVGCGATLLALSPGSVMRSAESVATSAWAVGALSLAATVVGSRLLFRERPPGAALVVGAILAAQAVFWAVGAASGYDVAPWRYHLAALPALAGVVGGALAVGLGALGRGGRGVLVGAALCGVAGLSWPLTRPPEHYERLLLEDGQAVAEALARRGYDFEAGFARLRGVDSRRLVAALSLETAAGGDPGDDVLVLKVPDGVMPERRPERWTVVPAAGAWSLVVRPLNSWLGPRARVCARGTGPVRCVETERVWREPAPASWVRARAYPSLSEWPEVPEGPFELRWEIPVRREGTPRLVAARTVLGEGCGWTMLNAQGATLAGAGEALDLSRPEVGRTLVLSRRHGPGACESRPPRWPPDVVEVTTAETELRQLLGL